MIKHPHAKSRWATRLQQGQNIRRNAFDRIFRHQQLAKAGKTPYDTVYSNGLVSLRHYVPQVSALDSHLRADSNTTAKPHRIPLVIIPPLAVNMLIYDLFPERSLVGYLVEKGFNLYLIDWGKPGLQHTDYDVSTYVKTLMPEFLEQVRKHSGEQALSLHGWSLGGAFALIYSALFQDPDIRNLVILGAPVDTHKSGYMGEFYQFLHRQAQWIRQNTNLRLQHLPSRYFHVRGMTNTLGFKMTDPIGNLSGYWQLFTKVADREYVVNNATSSAFLDHMLDYPGGVMRDVILKFWIDNELSTGKIQLGQQVADLANVQSALLTFGGLNDNIVTAAAIEPLLKLVNSTDKEFVLVPGGHMGIVSGSKAIETIWEKTSEWLSERSD